MITNIPGGGGRCCCQSGGRRSRCCRRTRNTQPPRTIIDTVGVDQTRFAQGTFNPTRQTPAINIRFVAIFNAIDTRAVRNGGTASGLYLVPGGIVCVGFKNGQVRRACATDDGKACGGKPAVQRGEIARNGDVGYGNDAVSQIFSGKNTLVTFGCQNIEAQTRHGDGVAKGNTRGRHRGPGVLHREDVRAIKPAKRVKLASRFVEGDGDRQGHGDNRHGALHVVKQK